MIDVATTRVAPSANTPAFGVPLDRREIEPIAERLGQHRRHLETAEPLPREPRRVSSSFPVPSTFSVRPGLRHLVTRPISLQQVDPH